MKNFKSGNRSRDRRDSERPLLHDAVCDKCGKDCKVPFKPSDGRPIYCSDCFEKKDGSDSNRSRDRRDSEKPLLHDAVCDKCGKDCKVPFKPSGERPIYCSDCFEKKGGSDSNRSRDRRDSPRRGFGGRDLKRPLLHDAVCDKCGKDCKVPFKPSGERPIYCSDCFEKKDKDSPRGNLGGRDSGRFLQSNISDRSILQLVEKINILNIKLDTIIDLLSLAGEKKPELVEVKTKKSEKSKTKKAKKATKAKKK